ncbi:hypothetical protein Q8A67_005706 [Cirrhinus molitorella]|uniref:NACHT domain-containing protein n=1 Tax=Cirrhinus molitorella TaxID=172907 RepID=A0AA88PZG1_9TELE|nr:hypothetical protein Q8A67_005706 [Cirrhinus molitorella]
MSEEKREDSLSERSLSQKQSVRSGSHMSSSVSVKSDWSKDEPLDFSEEKRSSTESVISGSSVSSSVSVKSECSKHQLPDFNEETPSTNLSVRSGSHMSSSVSVKSDRSKDEPLDFSEEKRSSTERYLMWFAFHRWSQLLCRQRLTLQYETLDSDFQTHRKPSNFTENLLGIFQDLEIKIITFLKKELEKFKKILQKEKKQYLQDINEDGCSIKETALNLALYFLREMKQDEAANTLEDELVFIHQLKCSLKKKFQCVLEGIAKQGDSTLLNNIYTDLYITQGCSEQVNTEHEVRQIEVASRRYESQEIPIECKKLFKASEQDKEIRTVLTKGVAGIGKSVSVQKFVLDWAEGKENQDISFIFPLPFREMNLKEKEKLSLMDLISQFFPETKGLNLTRRKNFKVLFILDGLDEFRLPLNFDGNETWHDVSSPASLDVILMNLIKGNLLPSALIWITTRPAAATKIPPDCVDRLTEIRGFNDAQKEEYFRKRFADENQAKEIIDHVKQSKSLFIMCHIPVFCWISATVLKNILEEKRNSDLKNNQVDSNSKTLQESNTEDTPKTLTQMYTHFLRFQILQSRRKYDGEYTPDVSWDKNSILSLGKLAFQELERNNVIFYDTDLEACGIDVYKASVYSGMCTQIFKKEKGIILGTMYCFVHLSIQEFIAALYAHMFLDTSKKSVFIQESTVQENKNETMIDLLKTAVDKALESDNGHLDLFLRFLLGLSIQSNRPLLRGLLTQQDNSDWSKKEIVQYIKQKFEANLSPERSINLFYCLNELNDQTLVKEIQTHLSRGNLSSADLSPAQWSALAFVLLTSEQELEEFELQKFKKSDECLIRLSAVIKTSKRALLNDCDLTERSCSALATVLGSDSSLKELNMNNNNNLQDSGVKLLCTGLKNMKCKLEILRLSDCSITEEGYKSLASALRSNPSHLKELDLTGNDPGQSGVKELNDLLQDQNCQLKTLRFLVSAADEACQYVTGIVGKNLLLLRELNLSEHELGDTRVNQIASLLQDKHCQLNTLMLCDCGLTEESCSALATVLRLNTSLKELDMSNNNLKDSGVKKLQNGLENTNCTLEKLRLSDCNITEEGYIALASALRSNPSHLIELDLTGNDPGQSGVKQLNDLLQDPNCRLKTLRFLGPEAVEACQYVTEIVDKNPLLLRELNLSQYELGEARVNQIAALLQDKHCKLDTLMLCDCGLTEESCSALATVLSSNSSLKELDMSNNNLQDSGVKKLQNGLKDTNCMLEKLRLSDCNITEEGYKALASALRSNPSHLIELDLTGNDPGQSGVKELNDLLQDPNSQLKILRFLGPAAEEACQYVIGTVGKNPLLLRELNLSERKLGDTQANQIAALLQDKHCKLNTLMLNNCKLTEKSCQILATVLSSKTILKEMDLNNNHLLDSGVKEICEGIKNPVCELKILKLSNCSITEEGFKALSSALRSNPSHLIELDLTGNDPGESGVEQFIDLLQNQNYSLKTLRLLQNPDADEACQYVIKHLGKNPLLLRELNLSEHELGDTRVNQITALVQDKHCTLNKLILSDCSITEEGYKALASALRSNHSHLIELDLTGNDPGQSGVKELIDVQQNQSCKLETLRFLRSSAADEACEYVTGIVGKNPLLLRELNLSGHELGDIRVNQFAALLQDKHCKLNTLTLCGCSITEKLCPILILALCSNLSHLRELNLSDNRIKNKGVKHLSEMLTDVRCKLERLSLRGCEMTGDSCSAVTSALNSSPSHLRELDLSGNKLGDSGFRSLSVLLRNPQCKLETLYLCGCGITEKQCLILTLALKSNPSHLRNLNLSGNQLGDSGVENLGLLLSNPQCKLKKLHLCKCSITEKQCLILTSALKSNLSHLRELDLSGNNIENTGVKHICDLLNDFQCKLKRVSLNDCGITDVACLAQSLAEKNALQFLRELDLRNNMIGDSKQQLSDVLKNSNCNLR